MAPKHWPCQQILKPVSLYFDSRSVLVLLTQLWRGIPWIPKAEVSLHGCISEKDTGFGMAAVILLICYHLSQNRKTKHKMLSWYDSMALTCSSLQLVPFKEAGWRLWAFFLLVNKGSIYWDSITLHQNCIILMKQDFHRKRFLMTTITLKSQWCLRADKTLKEV